MITIYSILIIILCNGTYEVTKVMAYSNFMQTDCVHFSFVAYE